MVNSGVLQRLNRSTLVQEEICLQEVLRLSSTGAQLVEIIFFRHCKLFLVLFSSCSSSHPATSGIKGLEF